MSPYLHWIALLCKIKTHFLQRAGFEFNPFDLFLFYIFKCQPLYIYVILILEKLFLQQSQTLIEFFERIAQNFVTSSHKVSCSTERRRNKIITHFFSAYSFLLKSSHQIQVCFVQKIYPVWHPGLTAIQTEKLKRFRSWRAIGQMKLPTRTAYRQ